VFVFLVVFFLILNSGGAVYLLAQANFERWKKTVFALAALTSLALKLVLATRGHNFDLDSYGIVASLVLHGKSVYANTVRYNYGPLWAFILAGLKQISTFLPAMRGETFHVTVAAFLGVTDVAMAAALSTKYRYGAGIFLLCCPASIFLTGYHSQFENFTLLAGLASWLLIHNGSASTRRLVLAAGLQGISLVIKHVLFLFPLWIFFWTKLGSWRKRAAYVLISYGIFGLSFLPWMFDPPSRAGIIRNVFLYRSEFTYSISQLLASISFLALLTKAESAILTLAWIVVVMVAGTIVARRKVDLFVMYLLAMFTFSPALRDQYLAIALLAGAILYTSWPCWALTAAATLALLSSPDDIFLLPLRYYFITLVSTQICAAGFFLAQLPPAGASGTAPVPTREGVRNALALALGSFAVVWVILLAKSFATL
jgi:hypothetical protein